jgi:ribose 5-phosphate isomerase B
MKVYFAADHAGLRLKNELLNFVRGDMSCSVEDCGAFETDASDDYPGIIAVAARALQVDIKNNIKSCAIILGGSGTGEAIVANRFAGIRAAVYYGGPDKILELSRKHNDANVLSLGARFLSLAEAKDAVRLWLRTPFSGDERHVRRVAQIEQLFETDL